MKPPVFGEPRFAGRWPKTGPEMREAGYRPMPGTDGKMTRCEFCNAPIYFVTTPNSKVMAVEKIREGENAGKFQHHRVSCAQFQRKLRDADQESLFEQVPGAYPD